MTAEPAGASAQKGRMLVGLETCETIILESGASLRALGLGLITVGLVGALLVRRQYGAVFPLGLILAAGALLLWWEPLARAVASFSLLLIGYTWGIATHTAKNSHWRFTPGLPVLQYEAPACVEGANEE